MITKGFISSAVHQGFKKNFDRKVDDGQDVVITVATRNTDVVQDDNPLNPGFTVTETNRTVRVIARFISSISRGSVTNPYEEKILTKLGLQLKGDLLVLGKYEDYEDFRNCVELSYVDKRFTLNEIQPGYDIGSNSTYLFGATFNMIERSTN